MAKQDHVTPADLEALHQPPEGAAGKGCLSRHQRRKTDHKCSHQWQAVVKANANLAMYNKHPDWGKGYTNFQKVHFADLDHYMAPFCHNAHHMIPNGALKTAISEAGANLANLIQQSLLKATYNLNDEINMIILPIKSIDGVRLSLPRHLAGDEVGPGEEKEFFSHRNYSADAVDKMKPVMDDYKKIADEAVEAAQAKHEKPNPTLSKAKLEFISNQIHAAIKTVGLTEAGKALSQVSKQIFALV